MPKTKLPNGCAIGKMSVHPKNWNTKSANIKKDWYVSYRFYDPKFPKPKPVQFRGMNEHKTLKDRQEATRLLIENELNTLKQGYNPNTGSFVSPIAEQEVSEYTPFINALWVAFKYLDRVESTMRDIKCVINAVEKAANKLGLGAMPIKDIGRRHIRLILEKCKETNKKFSNYRHNQYRTYLMILFSELIEMEVVENDPVIRIKKKKTIKRIRETLTLEERKEINLYLKANYYTFWRFVQIFFHAGCREIELLSVKYENVKLGAQRFKVTVRKGRTYAEEWRPIKSIILPLWQEIMQEAKPRDFIFAEGLRPGKRAKPILRDQITRRWRVHVKEKMGITADLYSLKHSNLDEVAEILSDQEAARLAGHKSTVITLKHYLVNAEDRKLRRLKDVNNKFA